MKKQHFKTREAWRKWLSENHQSEESLWLIFFKTGEPTIDYEAAVEEALCFGWVDSLIKKIDESRYARKFTPRKADSKWSEINKKRVEKMIKAKRMTEAGLALVRAAKKNGQWDKPDRPQISFEIPEDFRNALNRSPKAKKFFERLAPGYRRSYIAWIATAKRPETKSSRISESIDLLSRGEKLGMK